MTRSFAPLVACLTALLAPVAGRAPVAAQDAASPRVRHTINEGWRFTLGDPPGGGAVQHDDAGWTPVALPHTWNARDAFTESRSYHRGPAWYRKRLPLDAALRGKRLFLFFEGVNQVADVYVNGRSAGSHVGGYTAFAFDVTDLVTFDRPNMLAVRVDNAHDEDIPPLNADFTFYGGIYRDIWLIATDPVHVTVLDHASPGVFIDTPEVSAERATVRVRGTVMNTTGSVRRAEVMNRVLDPEGREVATLRSDVALPPSGTAAFRQDGATVERPRLWSPAEPLLYTVVTEVRDSGRLVDRVVNPLGFRWFRFDAREGFFLNGRPHQLIGTNRHQDREGHGNALSDDAHREDVALVKATGFDFLRLAHYPQEPAVLEEMDRLGLVGWEEIPIVNTITTSPAFADNAERMLVEMIRQHHNHPSILFWGYMNEVLLQKPSPTPLGYREAVLSLARRLDARAHEEDPSRATVMAVSFDEIDDGSGVQDVADILGLNLYFGWYYRALEGLGPYLDSLHARHPARPLVVSEYGAGSDERIHTTEPGAFDFSTEYQQRFHEAHLPALRARPYIVATAVWNQFDFGSKGRHDSKPNLNQKGLLYFDRMPKDVWHYYRAVLLDEPVLHIATRDWTRRVGSRATDAAQPVVVYSNLDDVELFANGVSLGVRRPQNATARWTVTFRPGPNRLEARSRNASRTAEDAITVSYEDRAPLLHEPAPAARDLAVNAGAHYEYLDEHGVAWEPDRPYEPGGWGYVGGEAALIHHRIAGTPEDALFQASREGVERYEFDVVDGEYDVRLVLVETKHAAGGERVFDIYVNDQPAFTALDLAGGFGQYVAVERTARITASGGRGIIIRLEPRAGETTVSGIHIHRR